MRRAIFVAIGAVLAAAAACSFPSVTFSTDESNLGTDASEAAATTDAGVSPPDDAATRDEQNQRVDAAGCGSTGGSACDCDDDDAGNSIACGAPEGGVDCDDFDPLIHPNQPQFVIATWPSDSPHTPAGDWDCNGVVEKQYAVNLPCTVSVGACTGEGFQGDPACGETADYFKCTGTITCTLTKSDSRAQGCK